MGASVYVDGEAMLTLLDRDAPGHFIARTMLDMSLETQDALVTSSHDVVRASLLVQERHGLSGLNTLLRSLVPLLRVQWCSQEEHDAAVELLFVSPGTEKDLVTAVGNLIMRRRDITPLLP